MIDVYELPLVYFGTLVDVYTEPKVGDEMLVKILIEENDRCLTLTRNQSSLTMKPNLPPTSER